MARKIEAERGDPEQQMARNIEVITGDPEQQMTTQQRANSYHDIADRQKCHLTEEVWYPRIRY
jgi:hypothetical protein